MNSERWERIKELFEAARSRNPAEREAFLAEACGGDDSLRVEVRSLLSGDERAGSFLAVPVDVGITHTITEGDRSRVDRASKSLGGFQLVRLIGRGGMGSVYEAYEQSMRRMVAVKILDSGIDPSANELSRFEREAWIAGRLNHPNIVKAYSQGSEAGTHFIAMELIDGGSLAGEIRAAKDSGQQPGRIRQMVSLFAGVVDALQHLHEKGVIHRDIKPQNLLLTKDGERLLLTDFGLARDEQASQLTRRGDFLGTVRYMSPEQLLAQRAQVDRRSDIWSIGVSLYEAVTLDVPYSAASEEAYISAVSMREPVPARGRNPTVSRDLETVLMKCLERNPDRRYGTATELRDDLLRFLKDEPVLARRPGPLIKLGRAAKRHRAAVTGATVSAIIALLLLVVLVRWQRSRAEDERIRWVLQQAISTNSDPAKLDPDWEHLQQKLLSRSKQNPGSDLALLANRAAIETDISLPSFGLISNSPELWWGFKTRWPLDPRYLYLMDFEASLDGGAWVPVGSFLFPEEVQMRPQAGGGSKSVTLEELFGKLSQVQHRVALRTKISYLDASAVPAQTSKDIFDSSRFDDGIAFINGPFDRTWQDLRKSDFVRFTETRSPATLSINLYDRYPLDFPPQVFAFPGPEPLESYFAPNRLRIIRLRLPEGRASGITFEWPSEPGEKSYCSTADSVPADRVIAMELFGRMVSEIPVPLAAEAELFEEGSDRAVLTFPFALGAKMSNAWWDDRFTGLAASVDLWRFYFSPAHGAISQMKRLDDRTISGRLILKPSRTVALRTQSFERYFGQPMSIPIKIEITTVGARWIDFKECH
jgi:serine/threonine protein kinase